MISCYLTDRQKGMLTVIADYLKKDILVNEWSLTSHDNYDANGYGLFHIVGRDVPLPDALRQGLAGLKKEDLNDFEECGLLQHWKQGTMRKVRLQKSTIIAFVENGYKFDDPSPQPLMYQGASSMSNSILTDRQKKMLSALVPYLRQGIVESEWIITQTLGSKTLWNEIMQETPPELDDLWADLSKQDLRDFEECGLLLHSKPRDIIVRLNKAIIIAFVENDFKHPEPQSMPNIGQINITGSQNVNVANINSAINQSIQNSPIDDDERAKLLALIERLNQSLAALPAEHSEAKEVIQEETMALVESVEKQRSHDVVSRKADALVKAAEVVRKVSTEVILSATAIGVFVLKLQYLSGQ